MTREANIIIEHPAWVGRAREVNGWIAQACRAALDYEYIDADVTLSVVCTDDARVHDLNHQFRGCDAPTNVLAFPGGEQGEEGERYLGDIVLSMDTLMQEAWQQSKRVEDHLRHLVIHAVLHLLGYDHDADAEAELMEAREAEILQELGVANPY